jgi:hypothetical protein
MRTLSLLQDGLQGRLPSPRPESIKISMQATSNEDKDTRTSARRWHIARWTTYWMFTAIRIFGSLDDAESWIPGPQLTALALAVKHVSGSRVDVRD